MLRRCFSSLQLGAELFPTASAALAPADPWCLPQAPLQGHSTAGAGKPSPPAAQLAASLLNRDYQAGWHLFTHSRFPFNAEMLSKLLAVLPSGAETAHVWWPRALQIKQALDARKIRLSASDYAVLINLAAKARRTAAVNTLWHEMPERRVARDTNVWNHYIMAVCDANPQFWPWPRSRSTSFARMASETDNVAPDSRFEFELEQITPPATTGSPTDSQTQPLPEPQIESQAPAHAVVTLLERMELEGIARNSRTYELTALALARHHNLDAAAQLIARVWGPGKTSVHTEPGLSTLTAIVDSFAFHSRLEEGYTLASSIGSSILGIHAANEFWTRFLRLAVAQTEPRGNVRTEFVDKAWREMAEVHKFVPKLGVWSIRIEFLELKNRFDEMFAVLPDVLKVAGGSALAESIAMRAATGLGNTGRALDALRHLRVAKQQYGVEPSRNLDTFLAEHGATLEQLEIFDEDDDEDGFTGSHIV